MSKLSNPSLRYVVRRNVATDTLAFIRMQGSKRHEGVVLWLGRVDGDICDVVEALIPRQETSTYRFDIPDPEIFRILDEIAVRGLVIPIQVHSHPGVECHSLADEAGAVVQHEGGLSIVVPHFGSFAADELLERILVYRLDSEGEWIETSVQGLIELAEEA